VVPGKEVLAGLRKWAQDRFEVTLTTSLIISKMSAADLGPDLKTSLERLDAFRLTTPSMTELGS
jgi:hypothetical protein